LTPLVAAATFFAVWPRMWTGPVVHLRVAWKVLKQQHIPEHYLGAVVQVPDWHYFPVYLLATAPVLLLCAALAGARRQRGTLVLLAWLLIPFGVAWSPVQQDGIRYVVPALVPLALLAAVGLARLPRGKLVAGVLAAVLAVTCVRIYPYYLDYFGEHTGGPAMVQRQKWFEVGWWGEGVGEAVAFVNAHAAPNARVYRLVQPTHVTWFRGDLWADTTVEAADWIVVNELGLFVWGYLGRPPFVVTERFTLAHEVRAQGAILARVYRAR
jgi:hypothetical protein